MKSEWRVTTNIIDGRRMYAVYRLLDVTEGDHSGNREFAGDYIDCKDTAKFAAKWLNREK